MRTRVVHHRLTAAAASKRDNILALTSIAQVVHLGALDAQMPRVEALGVCDRDARLLGRLQETAAKRCPP